MTSKKSGKPVRKPARAAAKKSQAKSAAAKKPARPVKKAAAKAAPAKATAKPVKPVKPVARTPAAKTPARAVPAKPAPAKQPHAKAAAGTAAATPALKGPPSRPGASLATGSGKLVGKAIAAVRPGATDEDIDAEAASPPSLLAGPRNVKPYVPRRGEQYMNKEQLDHFARILQSWKRDLMVEVDRTVLHMKDEAANFPDPNDRATQEEEFSLELRTRDRERKLIRKIDEALKRIEDGNYGYCLETGEEIGIKRLEARPVATLSVEAQERRERREKQYGDRDDRYR
ncbi:MAG: RNA polymerase-binding protein DksA [Steroidobacterales bacterium]